MGTGKSTVGKVLAERLGFRFIDLDEAVVADAGKSVSEIFADHGEPHFRMLETAALARVCRGDRVVVATGGGAVIASQNRELFGSNSLVVNLMATAVEIHARLAAENERPLLRGNKTVETIQRMLTERERFYAEADVRIDTAGKSVDEIVDLITSAFMEHRQM
jgi:shikimate kinase